MTISGTGDGPAVLATQQRQWTIDEAHRVAAIIADERRSGTVSVNMLWMIDQIDTDDDRAASPAYAYLQSGSFSGPYVQEVAHNNRPQWVDVFLSNNWRFIRDPRSKVWDLHHEIARPQGGYHLFEDCVPLRNDAKLLRFWGGPCFWKRLIQVSGAEEIYSVDRCVTLFEEFRRVIDVGSPAFEWLCQNAVSFGAIPFLSTSGWFSFVALLADTGLIPSRVTRCEVIPLCTAGRWSFKADPQQPGRWSFTLADIDPVKYPFTGLPQFVCIFEDYLRASELACLWMAESVSPKVPGDAGFAQQESEATIADAADSESPFANWPRITDVAGGLDRNRGEIARLLRRGILLDNGETGAKRRVDPASVIAYCKSEGIAYNEV